jgi:UDP-GlcNAc3NAcA epimerase
MKISTIVGARPQFIKAAAVSRALQYHSDIQEIIIHTGQHYDNNMSSVFFDELDIPQPAYNLKIGGGTHGQNTGRMIEGIESILLNERPDYALVYGDTDSTLAGALAAVKLHIPVIHIEAGLRSNNKQMPEEINRVLTDHIADLLFAPTQVACENLKNEGIDQNSVHLVGDVMYDATLFSAFKAELESNILSTLSLQPKKYILATFHRQENTDNRKRLTAIIEGCSESDLPIVLPLHPRTATRLKQYNLLLPPSVHSIQPVGYLDMIMLEKHASLIVTDSGGIQKEAYFQKVPCLTLRDETEWIELIDCGANQLLKAESEAIKKALASQRSFPSNPPNLYGSGNASNKIADILCQI